MERAELILNQILKGGSLADKLSAKDLRFDDLEWPSAAPDELIIEQPGRTGRLKPRTEPDSQNQFPKTSELKQESARGRLLHFFANHELLAIETMAYALLKFPTAPDSFKRGLFRTLQDEQRHLSQYIHRMHEFGVDLGDIPLNLYFWNTLKTIQTPLDYVVQMSLTFEQANLDFAEEYAVLLENQIGDQTTAQLLREVHDDEIKHVAHGWKWFQEWKKESAPTKTDFEFYQTALPFPMTARRARGKKFFAASARKQAGLTPDFIDSVRITGGSRGRVPNLYVFNPECEIETENTKLSPALKSKIDDLRPLLLWCASEEDLVELEQQPPLDFLKEVFRIKGALPEILTENHPLNTDRIIHEFKPWGWGVGAWNKLNTLPNTVREKPKFPQDLHSKNLFSKNYFKEKFQTPGQSIPNTNAWEAFIQSHPDSTTQTWIVKSDKSASGRGHQLIQAPLTKTPSKAPPFVIEPFLKKVFDFSIQYEISRDGKFKAFEPRMFKNDKHFQYQGAFLGQPDDVAPELLNVRATHIPIIEHLSMLGYHGPVGIDALVYEDENGELRPEPVIEVNARMTMGRVAHHIEESMKKALGHIRGVWVFLSKTQLTALGFESFEVYESALKEKYGPRFFPTTPAKTSQHTWTFVVTDEKFYSDFKAT